VRKGLIIGINFFNQWRSKVGIFFEKTLQKLGRIALWQVNLTLSIFTSKGIIQNSVLQFVMV
jgi:hypothetical protein